MYGANQTKPKNRRIGFKITPYKMQIANLKTCFQIAPHDGGRLGGEPKAFREGLEGMRLLAVSFTK